MAKNRKARAKAASAGEEKSSSCRYCTTLKKSLYGIQKRRIRRKRPGKNPVKTFLFVSHDPSSITGGSSFALIFDAGRRFYRERRLAFGRGNCGSSAMTGAISVEIFSGANSEFFPGSAVSVFSILLPSFSSCTFLPLIAAK